MGNGLDDPTAVDGDWDEDGTQGRRAASRDPVASFRLPLPRAKGKEGFGGVGLRRNQSVRSRCDDCVPHNLRRLLPRQAPPSRVIPTSGWRVFTLRKGCSVRTPEPRRFSTWSRFAPTVGTLDDDRASPGGQKHAHF